MLTTFKCGFNRTSACVADVTLWLQSQALSVNRSKTEIMVLGSRQLISKVPCTDMNINGTSTLFSSTLRDLGVFLDNSLTFDAHISKVCSGAFASLRTISRVRRSLSTQHCSLLINSLVLSRILFCATIYYGISNQQTRRLERILQAARRLLLSTTTDSTSSNSGLLSLPIDKIIQFRIAVMTFVVLHTSRPGYLRDLLQYREYSRDVRTSQQSLLDYRRSKSELGRRAFSIYAPMLFNGIPLDIRKSPSTAIFKNRLLQLMCD